MIFLGGGLPYTRGRNFSGGGSYSSLSSDFQLSTYRFLWNIKLQKLRNSEMWKWNLKIKSIFNFFLLVLSIAYFFCCLNSSTSHFISYFYGVFFWVLLCFLLVHYIAQLLNWEHLASTSLLSVKGCLEGLPVSSLLKRTTLPSTSLPAKGILPPVSLSFIQRKVWLHFTDQLP